MVTKGCGDLCPGWQTYVGCVGLGWQICVVCVVQGHKPCWNVLTRVVNLCLWGVFSRVE